MNFSGGGEMGERIRHFDWSKTPIGPLEGWPQSLVTSVRIMLASRQPIWIGWGAECIYLYNDPYKAIIGGRHPSALGKPTREVWPEIWDVIGPMLQQAMGGVEGTYVEEQLLIMERHGFREETYYTYSYTPIPHQDGIGGIICANTDDTQTVIGRRRISLLQELASSANARNTVEVCERVTAALATNPKDLPFALIYLPDASGKKLVIAGTAGINRDHPIAPASLALNDDPVWSVGQVLKSNSLRMVEVTAFSNLPQGAWPQAPDKAVILPINNRTDNEGGGVVIAGLNPFRKFDEHYHSFLSLVASQIAAAVTHAQAYEAERKRAEAFAELDRAKTMFFSNISHELRTPLTLMLGPIEDELREHPESRPRLEPAHRNSLRLLKLVNNLLDFSRLEAGRAALSLEPTDAAAYTAELASGFRSAMEKAGLKFEVECPPLPEPIHLDREVWEKVVLNLLSNAFKFTLHGGVKVELRQRGSWIELSVSDTGLGIPATELPRLFERFHRVRQAGARTHEGTGIGLALVQELVRLHGGEIRATSLEGKGTTMTVTVPVGNSCVPNENSPAKTAQVSTVTGSASFIQEADSWLINEPEPLFNTRPAPASQSDHSISHHPGNILVVEDNADMRQYITRLLRQHYHVTAVSDGQAALELLQTNCPDLVLSDIMMPRMDGIQLLRELRARAQTRTIPVILLSARAGEEARIQGMSQQADDYLVKPFSSRELLARVSAHMGLARSRKEIEDKYRDSFEREQAARQEVETAMRAKDQFLATLSHELRTPLSPVLLIASDAVANPNLTPEIRDQFEVILKNIEVEAQLIDDLLDLSRITHGKMVLKKRTVDAHQILQEALQTIHDQLRTKRIVSTIDLKAGEHFVSADSVRLQQVFWNVLRNAVKFTPSEGKINIESFLNANNSRLCVRIKDSGIGMTPEELDNAFLAFAQGAHAKAGSTNYGGLGLGLAITRKLVELHSGSIQAMSDGRNRGSTFTIELPVSRLSQ